MPLAGPSINTAAEVTRAPLDELKDSCFSVLPRALPRNDEFDSLTSTPWVPYRNSLTQRDSGWRMIQSQSSTKLQESVMLARGAELL